MSRWSDRAKFEALKKRAEQKRLTNENKKNYPIIEKNLELQKTEREKRHEEMKPELERRQLEFDKQKEEWNERRRKNQVSFDKEMEDISRLPCS